MWWLNYFSAGLHGSTIDPQYPLWVDKSISHPRPRTNAQKDADAKLLPRISSTVF